MYRKVLSLFLILVSLSIISLTGCTSKQPSTPQETEKNDITISATSNFNDGLHSYIKNSTLNEQNYMISPLSYRYVLAMATTGAKGDTQAELLKATGFKTIDEYHEWVENINNIATEFENNANQLASSETQYLPDTMKAKYKKPSLMIANSLWHISEAQGKLNLNYKNTITEKFNAELFEVKKSDFKNSANQWVNNKTNHMIQKLFDDTNISDELSTVLINTLYLKSGWKDSFNAFDTKQDKFTTVFGKKVVKDFMYQQNDVQYYEDNKTQLIVLPLQNGVSMAFVMGNDDNIFDKIKQSKYESVNIKIPKMEISTAVESNILIDFL